MKKILIHSSIMIVAAGLGLAIGFVWRGKTRIAAGNQTLPLPANAEFVQSKQSGPSRQVLQVPTRDDSPLATKLQRDLSMSSGVTKWLYWLEAIENAIPTDFPRLARLAQGNNNTLRLVAARWVEIAPRHLFQSIVDASKNGNNLPVSTLASVLFEDWPKTDPDAVIRALN